MKRKYKYVILIIIFFNIFTFTYADNYFIYNSLKARPIALGGAYLSLKNDIIALDYNPASFSVRPLNGNSNFLIFLNPCAIPVITTNFRRFDAVDTPIGLLLHGIGIYYKKVNIGIVIGEETLTTITRLKNRKITELSDYTANKKSSLCVSLELAPRVSIGIAGDCLYHRVNNTNIIKFGYRYGIWIKTLKKICIGLCFIDLPQKYREDRLELDRFDDETLNIGFSYAPSDFFQFALDIRNVSEDKKNATGEPHLGINLVPWRHLSLQGGFFEENKNSKVFSFGFGIFNENLLFSEGKRTKHNEFILNAAVVWKKNSTITDRWFILSSVIRI
ncbi:MAG: hypothetical protein R6V04_11230 [bacterium]